MKKIAVIEDDRVLRQSLAGILKENGYEVCCVEDFAHAEEEAVSYTHLTLPTIRLV